ncbi:MAG: STM4013/SEN3800 family hydrolase [Betaproteobacteria bacterium]
MNAIVGTHDIVFITLDTLRHDVAQQQFERGALPELARYLPPSGWECRHTPGSFTYAAHHAFFAGFLPTPTAPGPHPRLFAAAFRGSETIAKTTFVFEEDTLVAGLAARGYRTICIGGVGFFNQQTALARVLPGLFDEGHWNPGLGVTNRHSTQRQVALAIERLAAAPGRAFLFVNVSAIHSPSHIFLTRGDGATPALDTPDTLASHAAALRYVDGALAPLFDACARRAPTFVVICSDHGTMLGEAGRVGHRLAHEIVWNVPYAHFFIDRP